MKKIVPFNKVLKFKNNIDEITSISLEHNFNNLGDEVSGEFIINGEYVIKNDAREVDDFDFRLPFDIALGVSYDKDSMVLDIDDFRYQVISPSEVEVNIDLYIDGKEIPDRVSEEEDNVSLDDTDLETIHDESDNLDDRDNVDIPISIEEKNFNINDNENINDNTINNESMNGIFDNIDKNNGYSTYRVYTVMENDTVDTILAKYDITLEELNKYNDVSNLKPFDKLIIPSNEK